MDPKEVSRQHHWHISYCAGYEEARGHAPESVPPVPNDVQPPCWTIGYVKGFEDGSTPMPQKEH